MPCWARSRLTQSRSPGTRSMGWRASSSCSLVHGRTVRSMVGSPRTRRPRPWSLVMAAQRTSARLPFSWGYTYGGWSDPRAHHQTSVVVDVDTVDAVLDPVQSYRPPEGFDGFPVWGPVVVGRRPPHVQARPVDRESVRTAEAYQPAVRRIEDTRTKL